MFDPFPLLFKSSRWWLFRNIGRLLTSGVRRVEVYMFRASDLLPGLTTPFVKRWVDSRLTTHLINGGKYGSGIVYYLFYYLWRAHGGVRDGFFVLWCIAGVNYSMYAASWDLLMDWSLLRPHTRYPLLRAEVLYTDYIPVSCALHSAQVPAHHSHSSTILLLYVSCSRAQSNSAQYCLR
ncbi:hypothetical protein CERSUDRAFT_53432 [Gelatoporia subvermispora B]|uniref:EXS domain-containing protein n=1 Tax=Ceriporiopsis subvermispora (strain B) TaxID=914234 RepID=M2RA92_CERS8|nr:hypothetical protein CERSUDRAFT_53432 [Gelatoporia subvermispora B]